MASGTSATRIALDLFAYGCHQKAVAHHVIAGLANAQRITTVYGRRPTAAALDPYASGDIFPVLFAPPVYVFNAAANFASLTVVNGCSHGHSPVS